MRFLRNKMLAPAEPSAKFAKHSTKCAPIAPLRRQNIVKVPHVNE